MPESIVIPPECNGPLESGNGGYSAGAVAQLVGGAAEVSLRAPVPLGRPLAVERVNGVVRVVDGETVIAEGAPVEDVDVDVPAPVPLDAARAAAARYQGESGTVFSRCFVCGRDRPDAFGVFAGPVEDRKLVASPWSPPAWTAGTEGHVRPEFVWAVLDCPTYWAAYLGQDPAIAVLGRLTGRIHAPVPAEREHVAMAWPLEAEGRKRAAGCAVFTAEGELLAVARALLIELQA